MCSTWRAHNAETSLVTSAAFSDSSHFCLTKQKPTKPHLLLAFFPAETKSAPWKFICNVSRSDKPDPKHNKLCVCDGSDGKTRVFHKHVNVAWSMAEVDANQQHIVGRLSLNGGLNRSEALLLQLLLLLLLRVWALSLVWPLGMGDRNTFLWASPFFALKILVSSGCQRNFACGF